MSQFARNICAGWAASARWIEEADAHRRRQRILLAHWRGVRTYIDRKMAITAEMGHELIVLAPGTEDRVEERPGGGKIIYIRRRA